MLVICFFFPLKNVPKKGAMDRETFIFHLSLPNYPFYQVHAQCNAFAHLESATCKL